MNEETLELPASVATVADLLTFLAKRSDRHAAALEHAKVIRVAINHEHAEHNEPIAGAREIALFPPMTGG